VTIPVSERIPIQKPPRFRRRVAKLARDCEEQIATAEWWATNRTEHPPIDIEDFRVMLSKCRVALAAYDRADWLAFDDAVTELGQYAVQLAEAEGEE